MYFEYLLKSIIKIYLYEHFFLNKNAPYKDSFSLTIAYIYNKIYTRNNCMYYVRKMMNTLKKLFGTCALFTICLFAPLVGSAQTPETLNVEKKVEETSQDESQAQMDTLLTLIKERLILMQDIAKWKWNNAMPIENATEEKALHAEVALIAQKLDLSPEIAANLMQAQFNSSKLIQIDAFETFARQDLDVVEGAPKSIEPLKMRASELTSMILTQAKNLLPKTSNGELKVAIKEKANEILTNSGISETATKEAILPLVSPSEKIITSSFNEIDK